MKGMELPLASVLHIAPELMRLMLARSSCSASSFVPQYDSPWPTGGTANDAAAVDAVRRLLGERFGVDIEVKELASAMRSVGALVELVRCRLGD